MIDRSEIRRFLQDRLTTVPVVGDQGVWRVSDVVFEVFRQAGAADTVQHGGFALRLGTSRKQEVLEPERVTLGQSWATEIRIAFSLRVRDNDQDLSEHEIEVAGTDLLRACLELQRSAGLRITTGGSPLVAPIHRKNFLIGELQLVAEHRQPLE